MADEHRLDLGRRDALAARDVDVGQAVDDREVAVGVAADEVARVQAAAPECGGRGLRVAEVACEHAGPRHEQLAWFAKEVMPSFK